LDKLLLLENTQPWPDELIDIIGSETRVIYSDVDGTLLGPGGCLFKDSEHNFTGLPAQAILECHLRGIDIVLVSGRNRRQLYSDARLLGFKNWISELGCQISYNMGEVLVLNVGDFMTDEESVWQSIEDLGAPGLLLGEYRGWLEYHQPWSENRECTHLFRGLIDTDGANELLKEQGFEQLKVIDNGVIKRRSENLSKSIKEVHAYHLLPRASSKASAVRKDREVRNIPKKMTAAIGDSAADLELAPEVGVLFLVRNAVLENDDLMDRIKDLPNVFITHESMGLGWAEAIDFLTGKTIL